MGAVTPADSCKLSYVNHASGRNKLTLHYNAPLIDCPLRFALYSPKSEFQKDFVR